MKKPAELKNLIVVPVHTPIPDAIGKYSTTYVVQNGKGKTILSDDIELASKRFICDTVNRDEEQSAIDKTKLVVQMRIPGVAKTKNSSKRVYQKRDGTYEIKPDQAYITWLRSHVYHRAEYYIKGTLAFPVIASCAVTLVFRQPYEEMGKVTLASLIEPMAEMLWRMRVVRKRHLIVSFDGSKIEYANKSECDTLVTVNLL